MSLNKESKEMGKVKANGPFHFCSTIGQDKNQEKLLIPMGFMKYLKKGKRGLPGEAILTCSSGQSWKVKLSLDADGLFLSKGWGKFFKENNLCERDFLVFRYDGGKTMKFDVRVFGANGWPKVKASDSGKEIVCKQLENYTSQLVIVDMPLNTESNDMEKVEVNGLSHFCWTIGQDENQEKLMEKVEVNGPSHFCWTIGQDENQEKLPIPMGFMKYLKKGRRGLPGEAILTCSSGQSWKVNLSGDADGLFLSKGWGKFFKENNLCERDFLLFRYDGGKTIKFDVRVFGANGLPKVKGSDSGKENVCKQVENNTSQHVKDECVSLDLQPEISTHKRDELVETGVTTMALVRYPINEVQSPWSKSQAFSSSSPFFRCILDECSVKKYILKIPKATCPRNIFPSEKTDIILRNSNLQFWIVKVQPTTKAYTFRTAGWRKFVQENDLKEGYVCVFELMQIKELLVHVFH